MEWLVEHMDLVFGLVGALIGALASMAYKDMKEVKVEVSTVRSEIADVRENYLDRFSDLKETFKAEIKTLSDSVHEARLTQEKDFLRKTDCPLIHSKEKLG